MYRRPPGLGAWLVLSQYSLLRWFTDVCMCSIRKLSGGYKPYGDDSGARAAFACHYVRYCLIFGCGGGLDGVIPSIML